jgi:hypothetical protein
MIAYRLGWKPSLSFLQYGKQFNIQRQMHQTYLSRHKVEDFKAMQTQEARTLVRNLLKSTPESYEKFVSRYVIRTRTNSKPLNVTYYFSAQL